MDFTQWLQAKGIDPASLSLEARTALQASWRAEQNQQPAPPAQQVPVPQATTQTPPPQTPAPSANGAAQPSTFEAKMAAIEAENDRQQFIRDAVTAACEANLGNSEKCKQIRQLGEAAILDRSTTRDQFKLALLQHDRYTGPTILAPRGGQELTAEVLEAAVCVSQRLPNVEKHFSDQALQSAHTRFRRGLGLKQLIFLAAERNGGYRGSFMDEEAMCRAAFRPRGMDPYGPMATVPSTIDISGILSNVANKFLAVPFMFSEQAWREIARVRSANDFKQMTTYRLTSATKFEKVAPGGEIKHGTLGELSYTNQIDTYGKMLGFDRRDLINDDLGALTGAATELARGAGDSFNEVFWTEFLDDASFFTTGNGNFDDGATDSVLSLAGLENADTIFANQTKPDGTPLGVMPQILLVPRGLRATAMTLMSATGLVGQGFNSVAVPDGNPWAGMFRVVSSIYLANTDLGGSATAWYLVADPANLAVIEVAFLFGRDTPIVETSEFDFNRLGMSWRAYFDFGVAKQEYRAAVKLKGSA